MSLREEQDKVFDEIEEIKVGGRVSLVTPSDDFTQDRRICLTIICFPPKTVIKRIMKEIISPLKEADPSHYYYPERSLHYTINNVRTISDPPQFTKEDIEKLKGINLPKGMRFDFGGLYRMTIGIGIRGYPDRHTVDSILGLRRNMAQIGVPDIKTYVHPEIVIGNTSVCRFYGRPNAKFDRVYERIKHIKLGEIRVEKVSLVETNGVCLPELTRIHHVWTP
jgi:hypothetical protein